MELLIVVVVAGMLIAVLFLACVLLLWLVFTYRSRSLQARNAYEELYRARSQTAFLCDTRIRRFSGFFTWGKPRKRLTPKAQ